MTTPLKPDLTSPASVPVGNSTAPTRPPGASPTQGPKPTRAAPAMALTETPDDLLDMQRLDPATVDPNRHYRFVRKDEAARSKAKRRGYEIELTREGGPKPLIEGSTGGSGEIQFGDTILMSCPKAKHDARQRAKVKKTAERIASVQDKARQQAASIEKLTGHHVTMITDKE